MKKLGSSLGLLQSEPDQWLKQPASSGELTDDAIEALITERSEARANKDWARCDGIRDQLKEQGIVLEDAAGSTSWRRS